MKSDVNMQQKKGQDSLLLCLMSLLISLFLITPPPKQSLGAAALNPTELECLIPSFEPSNGASQVDEGSSACSPYIESTARNGDEQDPLSGLPGGDVPPFRCVFDPYPEFNGIAVDPVNNEVLLSDQNRKSLLFYERRAGSRSPEVTEPLRQVIGPRSGLGFVAGVAIDAVKHQYYAVNNDVEDRMVVFSRDAQGNALPARLLYTPHQVWGISLDQDNNELAITSEQLNAVFVYRKEAKGLEAPLRVIKGETSGMGDPHGIFIDALHNEIVVANHGYYHNDFVRYPYAEEFKPIVPSQGRFQGSSLTVYLRTANGESRPLRTIQGPNTQLKLPMGLHEDVVNDEIAVANNGDNSILIFRRTDSGDAKPARVIRGPATYLDHPMGVFIDSRNNELWVANFGNHSATVYARTAHGNVAPKRITRNAPLGSPTVGLGNPMAVTYNPARQEILVPN